MDYSMLLPKYFDSRALIIGINKYSFASPLEYAVNDARAVAEILKNKYNFSEDKITVLTEEQATRSNIMSNYLSFANDDINADDRILIFFAGHGYTQTGIRGEIGFLVPHDGNINDLSSLIRWDDLTRNAELIKAKHMLFIMDACYGGLAITRALPPGSMRFIKDMLQRYVRQVLTAGKANEVVSDAGGPIPNHSVFTGHFIQALEGKAASGEGIITANSVMSYVYEKVSKDPYSQQTPHYGFFDGDGDFIFDAPMISELANDDTIDKDILIPIPSQMPDTEALNNNLIDKTKQYLSDIKYKISLHDLINQTLREVISLLKDANKFSFDSPFNPNEFANKLKDYEDIMEGLQSVATCIAYWGGDDHRQLLQKIIARISDNIEPQGGLKVWINLRLYPLFLLVYSSGISAIACEDYRTLSAILTSNVKKPSSMNAMCPLAISIGDAAADLHEAFKRLPNHEKQYVPRSEYLYKLLQPSLDDLLFLGNDYERFFDRFEVLLALVHADLDYQPGEHLWGPPGRFAWKSRSRTSSEDTYKAILDEANVQKNNWAPLKAGLFSGSYDRFLDISNKYTELMGKLSWF